MLSITHAAIATAGTTIALGTGEANVIALAIIGSQLPDLDTTESYAGRALWPIAKLIESHFAHRTITHSFLSTGIVAMIASPLWLINWQYWAALVIGQFLGWFSDSFTRAGVSAFWPAPVKLVIPGNPKARLVSGSSREYWVLAAATFLAILFINIASAGNLSESFARTFFRDSATAAQTFHKYGSRFQVTIYAEGMVSARSEAIAGGFTILEANNSDVIAESQTTGRLYQIGSSPSAQIQPTSVKTTIGRPIQLSIKELPAQDILLGQLLQQIPPDAYLTGSLTLDEPVITNTPIGEYPTLRVFAGQLEVSNARPRELNYLREHWIVQGRLIAKTRR